MYFSGLMNKIGPSLHSMSEQNIQLEYGYIDIILLNLH